LADVIGQLRTPKRLGFLFVATFGILMFGSKAEEYYYNAFFRTKLTLFLLIAIHALIFRPGVYNNVAEFDRTGHVPGRAKLAAALSLILWTCVAIAGRGIGYIEPPLDKIHAGLSLPHSSRSAVSGSTRTARRAGATDAIRTMAASSTGVNSNVTRSTAVTP